VQNEAVNGLKRLLSGIGFIVAVGGLDCAHKKAPPTRAEAPAAAPRAAPDPAAGKTSFTFIGERLWLDFVNTEPGPRGHDALRDFDTLTAWLAGTQGGDARTITALRG